MARRDDSLALAYSTSDAYEHFHENRALIARVVEELHEHVDVDEQRFAVITERLYALLDTNRTAPAVMRMMSQADAVRIAAEHVHAAGASRMQRRTWKREGRRAVEELRRQVAATLDGLLVEPF